MKLRLGLKSYIAMKLHIGMKRHIGVDSHRGLAHSAVVTPANGDDTASVVGRLRPERAVKNRLNARFRRIGLP
jgi:IS5 family transposase